MGDDSAVFALSPDTFFLFHISQVTANSAVMSKQIQHKFSLDGSRIQMKLFSRFVLMPNLGLMVSNNLKNIYKHNMKFQVFIFSIYFPVLLFIHEYYGDNDIVADYV